MLVVNFCADLVNVKCVHVSLQAGANPLGQNHLGRTPIHDACQGGHLEVLQVLLQFTTDFDIPDKQMQTPAHVAAFNGEVECLQTLYDRGL